MASLKIVYCLGPSFKKSCYNFVIFLKQKCFLLPQASDIQESIAKGSHQIQSELSLPDTTNLNHSAGAGETLKQDPETYQTCLGIWKINCSECLLDLGSLV